METEIWPDFEKIFGQFVVVGVASDPQMLSLEKLWKDILRRPTCA
ncbi:hypothetical protein [Citrifermentans bremense]|nr:hypothetical protein [Citrifermentans bremense]